MFGFTLVAAGTLMHAYVIFRALSVPLVRRIPLPILIPVSLLLWLLMVLGRYVGHGGDSAAAVLLETAGLTWLSAVFITTAVLLPVDLLTGFGLWLRRVAPALRGLALLTGAGLSLLALIQGLRPPAVVEYEVAVKDLPASLDGLRLVALSDTHAGSVLGADWLEARVAQANALEPDVIVLIGDLLEGHGGSESQLAEIFGRLEAPLGVYAVEGNHDRYRGGNSPLALLERHGIQVLRNRWVEVRPGLVAAGVQDLGRRRSSDGSLEEIIRTTLEGRPEGATLFLSHTPDGAELAAKEGAGLMMSGHTHGGQIWPFNHVVRLRYPLLAGRYEVGGMTVLVSRGTGTWGPRMRLFAPGEILVVRLRNKDASPTETSFAQ